MKVVLKILIVILVLVVLATTGLILVESGVLGWFREPVIQERTAPPIPTEPAETEPFTEPLETIILEPEQPHAGTPSPQITAKRYFVYDVRVEEYLDKRGDGDSKLYPASITKLLTSYVVLQYLDPEEEVVVGDAMSLVPEDSSLAFLQRGDTLTASQLIAAMMLPSGNDAAQTAAVATGRTIAQDDSLSASQAVEVFVKEMNVQAQKLGMENSHFANPDGFHDDNHYTTMNDLVTLACKVLAEPAILECTGRAQETVELKDRSVDWENTNFLIHEDTHYYVPNAIGLKTGYTNAAGNCLLSAFFEKDRLLLIGVFETKPFTEDRFRDTVALYEIHGTE